MALLQAPGYWEVRVKSECLQVVREEGLGSWCTLEPVACGGICKVGQGLGSVGEAGLLGNISSASRIGMLVCVCVHVRARRSSQCPALHPYPLSLQGKDWLDN